MSRKKDDPKRTAFTHVTDFRFVYQAVPNIYTLT